MRRAVMMVGLMIFWGIAASSLAEEDLTRTVLRQTAEDYKVFQQSVEETEKSLDDISARLKQADKFLRGQKGVDPRLTQTLQEVQDALTKEREIFGRFSEFSKKTANGLDVYLKADQIISNANKRKGGPLARNMQLLATLMESHGGDLPVLGPAIVHYAKATTKLLDATDQISGTIERNFEQGTIGIQDANYNTADDELYQAFIRDFGEEAKTISMLMPQETAFVYQDDFNINSPYRYIWDGQRWHKINNDRLNIHQALTDSLLAGDRVDAERLLHMADNAEFYNRRRQSAGDIYQFIVALKEGINFDSTYSRIYRDRLGSRDWIDDAVRDPEAFLALYRCNEQFAIELNGALVEVYKELKKVDDPRLKDLKKRIRALETWAETANLDLPREPAAGEGILRARVVNKADGSPMAGALVVVQNRATGKRYRKRSDSQGVALIKELAAGDYRVGGRLKGFEDYSVPHWKIMKTGFTEITISLKPSQPKSNVAVVVIDQKTGLKIEGARVSFTGPQVFHTRAQNGTSSMALPAGDWTVNADAHGYKGMVSSVWVDPSKSPTIQKKMVLPPSEQELQKSPEETEMVFEAYEQDSLFTQTREPESAKADARADLPQMPEMPGDLSRQEIVQWRDETVARLRKEGNARLDAIRAALKQMEGKQIEHACHRCGHGGPHWWDGHGWTCSNAGCGATVMTAGEYPTASGSYKKTREHYLSLINKVQQQADARLR